MAVINIIHGDCMVAMARMKDKQYDLAICDPPYGIGLDKGGMVTVIPNKSINPIFPAKEWDSSIPGREYFDALMRVSSRQIIWGGNYFLDFLGYCKAPILWDKMNGDSLYADGELAWTGGKGMPRNLKIFRHQWCGLLRQASGETSTSTPPKSPSVSTNGS